MKASTQWHTLITTTSHHDPRGVNPWGWGSRPPEFVQGVVKGSINIIISYYRKYIRKWWLLKRNIIIRPEVAVNGHFCLENQNFCKIALKNRNSSEIFLEYRISWEIAWKIRNFSETCLENRNLVKPDPRPFRFQTRLTPLAAPIIY